MPEGRPAPLHSWTRLALGGTATGGTANVVRHSLPNWQELATTKSLIQVTRDIQRMRTACFGLSLAPRTPKA